MTATSTAVRYLGVDLAWSGAARSGVCAVSADGRILDDAALEPHDLVAWIRRWRGSRSVLAIDGPLVVPPGSGALRPVEVELHRRYGARHAGPFPGGARSLAMRGRERSPAAELLEEVGGAYVVDPTDVNAPHRAIEVFPAPTWLEVFRLAARIVYKRGRVPQRIAALGQLQGLLATLSEADPRLVSGECGELAARQAAARTGRDWKAVEDILDARLCAYVAVLWGRTPDPSWIVPSEATWRDGYVVVPRFEERSPAT